MIPKRMKNSDGFMSEFFYCEPKESNSGGGADFLAELKSSDCEPKESNSGGGAYFLAELKSSDW